MAVSLTHTQVRSITAGGLYKIVDTVSAAVGIAKEVFVLNADDATFDHVATVADMFNLPTVITPSIGYYRVSAVTKEYEDVTTAIQLSNVLRSNMQLLVNDYLEAVTVFVGTTTETLSGS